MRSETTALLALADAIPNYGREALLQDVEPLISAKRFYTTADLTIRYGVTVQTLINWANAGDLVPDLKVGKGIVRYSAAAVAAFEKKHPGRTGE